MAQLHGAKPLTIPPHLTGELQPLDVGFFRQLKIFIRRITEEALVNERISDITTREGIINLMSIIYNQLQSPAYYDLWRYAWRHTDPNFSFDEISNSPPANVNSVQFGFDPTDSCSVPNCTEEVIVRCSHDGRPLCLTHFLNRTHFHENDPVGDRIGLEEIFGPGEDFEEDEEDDVELLAERDHAVLYDFPPERQRGFSTSSTQAPDRLVEPCGSRCDGDLRA